MSNKNPFEIRTEILSMAKDYMDQAWHMNVDFTSRLVEQNKAAVDDLKESMKPYTIEELMSKAQEMYEFVCHKEGK